MTRDQAIKVLIAVGSEVSEKYINFLMDDEFSRDYYKALYS
jgi:hypothetical protein